MVMVTVTGFATEAGLTLICPTTGIAYQPTWARIETIDGDRYVQSACRWCDAKGRTRVDADYNALLPQIHTHAIDRSSQE
jgi:hypothetical protein